MFTNRTLYAGLIAALAVGLVALVAGAHALIPWLCAVAFAWFGVWCAGAVVAQQALLALGLREAPAKE